MVGEFIFCLVQATYEVHKQVGILCYNKNKFPTKVTLKNSYIVDTDWFEN